VLEAVDGQQAIEKASPVPAGHYPAGHDDAGEDGLQACREIREHTPTQSIPIVLLTRALMRKPNCRVVGRRERLPDKAVFDHRTPCAHQEPGGIARYQRKVTKQNQVLESTIEAAQGYRDATRADEKLASLGRMSAGIIHEINNPLNFRHDRPVHAAQERQISRARATGGISGHPEGRGRGDQPGENHRLDLRMFTHPETESRDQVEGAGKSWRQRCASLSAEWKDKVRIDRSWPPIKPSERTRTG